MPIGAISANDSNVSVILRPTGKSLSPPVDNHFNPIHPNRTFNTISTSTTISATDKNTWATLIIPTTISTTTSTSILNAATLVNVLDDHDAIKENDIFIQPRLNVPEVDKVDTIIEGSPSSNDSRNIVAMGYTNNSFEHDSLTEDVNDTYVANMTDSEILESTRVTSNMSHSSVANSNLIDNSGGNIDPGEGQLSAAGITGITVCCVSVVGLLSAVSFFLYRYRNFNRPEALNDYCSNLDSSGYIDDTSIRDNSEEMYSLDNDSFLNSLEAMTIQNYWTDKVKHTKL